MPTCCLPQSVGKKSIMPARQSGSPRQQCIGAISAFVDSVDSYVSKNRAANVFSGMTGKPALE